MGELSDAWYRSIWWDIYAIIDKFEILPENGIFNTLNLLQEFKIELK